MSDDSYRLLTYLDLATDTGEEEDGLLVLDGNMMVQDWRIGFKSTPSILRIGKYY